MIMSDLFIRSGSVTAFYTDAGVMPRTMIWSQYPDLGLSFHMLSGGVVLQYLLFGAAAVAAVMLAIGYYTRTATVVSWLLLFSLHNRNFLVLNSGDTLLRMALFWGMFLPLGATWSVDVLKNGENEYGTVFSVASIAIILQPVIMYTVAGVTKLYGEVWTSGRGIYYALSLEHFTKPLGDVIHQFPFVMEILSYGIVALWLASPLLLLLNQRYRSWLALAFIATHLGMALTMRLGLFPFIAIVVLLLYLDPDWIERIVQTVPLEVSSWVGWSVDGEVSSLQSWGTAATVAQMGSGIALVVVLLLNVSIVMDVTGHHDPIGSQESWQTVDRAATAIGLSQQWHMFAPMPPRDDIWPVIEGRFENGTTRDLFRGGPVTFQKPGDVSAVFKNQRWRRFLENVAYSERFRPHGEELLKMYCGRHDDLVGATISFVVEETGKNQDQDSATRTVASVTCGDKEMRADIKVGG